MPIVRHTSWDGADSNGKLPLVSSVTPGQEVNPVVESTNMDSLVPIGAVLPNGNCVNNGRIMQNANWMMPCNNGRIMQNANWVMPYNNGYGTGLSEKHVEALDMMCFEAMLKRQEERDKAELCIVKDNNKAQNDLVKERYKFILSEEKAANKDLVQKELFMDSQGEIRILRKVPEGEDKVSGSICNARNFVTYKYVSTDKTKTNVLQICWYGEIEGIFIKMAADAEKLCMDKMQNRGVYFSFPRRDRKEMMKQLYSLFVGIAKEKIVPEHIGWNKLQDGNWMFESNPKKTIRGLLDECN